MRSLPSFLLHIYNTQELERGTVLIREETIFLLSDRVYEECCRVGLRAVADHARALLPFPFSQRRAMCANVGSESGWKVGTRRRAVISEFLLVLSLPRYSRFMFRACARTRSSSTRSFVRFVRGAVRTTRSLVHHSWVTRKMDLLTLSPLRAGG